MTHDNPTWGGGQQAWTEVTLWIWAEDMEIVNQEEFREINLSDTFHGVATLILLGS